MVLLTHVLISLVFEVHLYHQAITSDNMYRLADLRIEETRPVFTYQASV